MRARKSMAVATELRQAPEAETDQAEDGAVLATAADVLAQLADPTRLHLVRLLGSGEQDVSTLTEQVAASRSSASQHLGRLRLAGLVRARRDGRRMLYRVTSGHLIALADQAFDFAEHMVHVVPRHHRQPSV